jgi:hypothetical protein
MAAVKSSGEALGFGRLAAPFFSRSHAKSGGARIGASDDSVSASQLRLV